MRSALAALLLTAWFLAFAQDSQAPAQRQAVPSGASPAQAKFTTRVQTSRAWQDTITLPTWTEGPPDIHPRFDALDPGQSFYPYTARTNLSVGRAPQTWRRLNLENEFLSCSFLPDLGGHLYSCTDKRDGLPMFHDNASIKKDLVGPRGAWVALGVEFNFPVTHSRDTVSPVDFGIHEENGRAEVWLADTDRVTGMRWVLRFTLRDGSAALEQRTTLSNPAAARHPYLYWANAGIKLDAGTRFAYPVHVMQTHDRTELLSWPLDKKGRDLSRPFKVADEITVFAYGSREPFMAVYNATTRSATVHVADPGQLPGKKVYHWGMSNMAAVVQHLSDDNTAYVEMQAGRFPDQQTYGFLEPGERIQFSELWMPGMELGGVTRANENAILSLDRAGGGLTARLNVTRSFRGARLALFSGGASSHAAPVWQDTADLFPAKSYEHTLPNAGPGPFRFELRDSSGKLLLEHTENLYEAVGPSAVKLGPEAVSFPGQKRETPGDFLAFAGRNEELSQNFFAEHDYRQALAKFAGDASIEKALGRLLVSEQRYSPGYALLVEASKQEAFDPELRYYLGLAAANTGRENEARQSLQIASQDKQFGAAALFQLAGLEARSGHAPQALDLARQAASRDPGFMPAVRMETALLRHAGQKDAALKQAEAGLAADPLDLFLRLELTRTGIRDDSLWNDLAGDSERVLEVAGAYLDMALPADAVDVLAHPYPTQPASQVEPGVPPPPSNPMVTYYRAYAKLLAHQDPAPDFELAATQPLAYVYPHGGDAAAALSSALEKNSRDASALYLTGLLYLSQNSVFEAADELKAALQIRQDLPAIHYLLGRTLLLMEGRKDEAMAILKQGGALNPADKELKKAIDDASRTPATAASPPATATEAAAPAKKPTTPDEIASAALMDAAKGNAGMGWFNARDLPQPKQSEAVMRAYVEVELQAMRRAAAHKDCASALTALDKLGNADPDLPFAALGFDSYTKGARYQYFLGAVEALCGQNKDAKHVWAKVAKMTPDVESADFAFPAVAAQSASGAKPDWNALLAQVDKALANATGNSKGILEYSKGILLLAKGDEHAALAAFRDGLAASSSGDFAQYLNQLAVNEASRAATGAR